MADEDSPEDELAAESTRPVATAVVQRQPGLPPALPGKRTYQGDGSNSLTRYIAGAIVTTGVIGACVILALCWPRRPEVPAKPEIASIAPNTQQQDPSEVAAPGAHSAQRKGTSPGDHGGNSTGTPGSHAGNSSGHHRSDDRSSNADSSTGDDKPSADKPSADKPSDDKPSGEKPIASTTPAGTSSGTRTESKRTTVVSYARRSTSGSTTTFEFNSPFKSEVEIARVRLLVAVDHQGQVHPDFKDLHLETMPDASKDDSKHRLMFKKENSQPDPYVTFSIPRRLAQAQTFAVEMAGPKIDEIPAAYLCGFMLALENGGEVLLLLQKACVPAEVPVALPKDSFMVCPSDGNMKRDFGTLGAQQFLSFKELGLIGPSEKPVELIRNEESGAFEAVLYTVPATELDEEIAIVVTMEPQEPSKGCPTLKARLTVGTTDKVPRVIIELRVDAIRKAWKSRFESNPIKDKIHSFDTIDKLKKASTAKLEGVMKEVKALDDKLLPPEEKAKASQLLAQILALKEAIDIVTKAEKLKGSSLKSGRITCRLQDCENVGSQAPTSEIDLILIGDAQSSSDIDYRR